MSLEDLTLGNVISGLIAGLIILFAPIAWKKLAEVSVNISVILANNLTVNAKTEFAAFIELERMKAFITQFAILVLVAFFFNLQVTVTNVLTELPGNVEVFDTIVIKISWLVAIFGAGVLNGLIRTYRETAQSVVNKLTEA